MTFSSEEFENLKWGRIPQSMDDKWFIFYEEDWVYLHRSWTGYCVAKVRIMPISSEEYSVQECWIERNEEFYKSGGDQADISLIKTMLSFLTAKPKEEILYEARKYISNQRPPKPWWKFW